MSIAEKKVVHHRLNALELAKALGNVSEACRHRGISPVPPTTSLPPPASATGSAAAPAPAVSIAADAS